MRVIDLLNKYANGEKLPKKIKYKDNLFIAKGNRINGFVDYVCDDLDYCFSHYVDFDTLNDEVEIIEEDKKIEKIDLSEWAEITYSEDWKMFTYDFNRNSNLFVNKINEIIDYLKEK